MIVVVIGIVIGNNLVTIRNHQNGNRKSDEYSLSKILKIFWYIAILAGLIKDARCYRKSILRTIIYVLLKLMSLAMFVVVALTTNVYDFIFANISVFVIFTAITVFVCCTTRYVIFIQIFKIDYFLNIINEFANLFATIKSYYNMNLLFDRSCLQFIYRIT